MNLNKFDRQAFVRAVMDDVPMIDYKEQGRSKAAACVVSLLPKEVQAVYKTNPNYLERGSVSTPIGLDNLFMAYPRDTGNNSIKVNAPKVWEELVELGRLASEQESTRKALESKLTAIIDGCRTLKQAKERLPEFEKYLPAERGTTGTTNLPVANLVAELNAAGWPKGK